MSLSCLLLALSLTACDEPILDPEVGASAGEVHVSVRPVRAAVEEGDTVRFRIEAVDARTGDPVEAAVVWEATGGSISGRGLYTAGSSAGDYRVTARLEERGGEDAATVTVLSKRKKSSGGELGVRIEPSSLELEPGDTATLVASVSGPPGHRTRLEWSSTAPEVTTVDERGTVTGIAPGNGAVVATMGDAADTVEVSVVAAAAPPPPTDDSDPPADDTEPPADDPDPQPSGPGGGWSLVFRDEFDGLGLPDGGKWNYRMPWWPTLSSGGEAQYDETGAHCRVGDGVLTLTATPDPYLGHPYTSCTVSSHGKYAFTYGAVEIRAKMPGGGPGFGPAFWLMPADRLQDPSLPYAEIDVLEYSSGWEVAFLNYFWGDDTHESYLCDWCPVSRSDFDSAFHTFGLVWEPGRLIWYVDGVEELRYEDPNVVRDRAMYLILNLAVSYYTKVDSSTRWPGEFVVDYVRVWER